MNPVESDNMMASNSTSRKIVIVSDVMSNLKPSGVTTAITNTKLVLEKMGHQVLYMTPDTLDMLTFPLYGIDERFRVAIPWPRDVRKIYNIISHLGPNHIHISTDLTLGVLVRSICLVQGWKFSTAFHTVRAQLSNLCFFVVMLSYAANFLLTRLVFC